MQRASDGRLPPPPGTAAPSYPTVPPPPPERTGGAGDEARRLHPAVMAVWPLSQVGPLLILIVAGTVSPYLLLFVVAGSVIASVVRYQRFRWHIDRDALVIEQGLLQRQRRVIPLERIQTVDLVRKLRHRLFGVVEVRVEAIGGGSTEGQLDALAPAEASELRARLLGWSRPDNADDDRAQPHPGGETLVHMRPGGLIVAGLTGGRVGVAAAVLGFGQQLFAERLDEVLVRAPALIGGLRGAIAVVIAVLVGAFVLSVLATVVSYWNFRLTREGAVLRIRRGLLEQRFDTIPLRRLQAIRVEENAARRLFGLAVVKIDVAGRAGGDEGSDTGTLLPLGSRAEAFALVASLLGRDDVVETSLLRPPVRARTRRHVRAGMVTAVLTVAALVVFGQVGAWALLVALPAVAAAQDAYRNLGHARLPTMTVARSGVLVRRTTWVPDAKLQSLALVASPLQRWRRLRTLDLQIARSPGVWSGPQVVDVDVEVGTALLIELSAASVRWATPDGAGLDVVVAETGDGEPRERAGGQREAVVGGGFEPP